MVTKREDHQRDRAADGRDRRQVEQPMTSTMIATDAMSRPSGTRPPTTAPPMSGGNCPVAASARTARRRIEPGVGGAGVANSAVTLMSQ